jgi:Zn-dependent peptidase ImmA (M78 family)/transcriptional regulator with XRE-family HTH domain
MNALALLIGQRVAMARSCSPFSQESLAEALGFKDRQTISAIEQGQRKVSPEELVQLAEILQQPVDYFTDPYLVAEKSRFSYRARNPSKDALEDFGRKAERLISAHRRFRQLLGEVPSPVHPQLSSISKKTGLEMASFYGERTAAAWKLGDVPAARLREAAEQELKISIFFVDVAAGISGAACHLDDGNVIVINRNEALGRLNFDIGHEIFHLLTWDRMPPDPMDIEYEAGHSRPHVEKLADSFTAGLLMPSEVVKVRWKRRDKQAPGEWVRNHARELLVSGEALYWRLVNLELIDKDDALLKTVRKNGHVQGPRPNLYNKAFVTELHKVLSEGRVTVLRVSELLDSSLEELSALFASYGMSVPFAL